MARIAIINPKFDLSYWGLEHAQAMMGKRANMPVASLPLLAALTPDEHDVELFDENVEELDFDRLAGFDIVGMTGMGVQRFRMQQILDQLNQRDAFIVVGGPWATVQEDYFAGQVSVVFVGEAEQTWPQFLDDWKNRDFKPRYEQTEKTDMTTVPTPRHDLLKNKHYLFGSVQFSRGCPFQCEFCDIIVTFGRRPRIKQPAQVIQELEALRAAGLRIGFIVDDNLIGNKRGIKPVLEEVARWQEQNGYPIAFATEASLDLCEDPELMELMARCNIHSVFIGIESPNEESLKETKKFQNVREKGGTMIEKIHQIQDFGLDVWCGLIVGFDHDRPEIFRLQETFLKESRIVHAMIGLLHAIPKTPLHNRLRNENRLDHSDELQFGTNVIPLHMSREELRDGYVKTMHDAYQADTYFARLDNLFIENRFSYRVFQTPHFKKHPFLRWKHKLTYFFGFWFVAWKVLRGTPDRSLRKRYRQQMLKALRHRFGEPVIYFFYAIKCAMHFHHHKMTTDMIERPEMFVSSFGKTLNSEETDCESHQPDLVAIEP